MTYTLTGHAETLQANDLLVTTPLGRALPPQFSARHADQVGEVIAGKYVLDSTTTRGDPTIASACTHRP